MKRIKINVFVEDSSGEFKWKESILLPEEVSKVLDEYISKYKGKVIFDVNAP
ncbi:MAG: hypothetical protein J7J52_04705 [Deltaproteobacteria bacterium]|nr:hypothetical protein [Deltaproteobacteria bacterium]